MNGIRRVHHDDGDRRGRPLRAQDGSWIGRDNHVDLQAHQIQREIIEPIYSSLGVSNFEDNVAAFDISQLAQALFEFVVSCTGQDTDPIRLRRPLRTRDARRDQQRTGGEQKLPASDVVHVPTFGRARREVYALPEQSNVILPTHVHDRFASSTVAGMGAAIRSLTVARRSIAVRSFVNEMMLVMDRRTFIGRVAGGLLAAPLAVRAQRVAKVYRIGILEPIPAAQNAANLDALRKGLRDLGYVEGRNLVIEYRSADGRAERFPELASELVRLKLDLIVTRGTPAARAAKNATETIPVVMATMGDPRAIVASFARPGGNITGVTTFSTELTAKRIELLKELVPNLLRIALLHNMGNPAAPPEWEETKTAARSLGVEAELLDVRSQGDLDRAFERAVRQHVDALLIGADGLTQMHQQRIIDLVARNRLPAAYPAREFVEAGGLMAYAVNYPELYFRFASFVDRIFKGAKPGDLPVEQPTKFELAINLKTAKTLGLTIPQSVLVRANEVIR